MNTVSKMTNNLKSVNNPGPRVCRRKNAFKDNRDPVDEQLLGSNSQVGHNQYWPDTKLTHMKAIFIQALSQFNMVWKNIRRHNFKVICMWQYPSLKYFSIQYPFFNS